MRTTDPKFWEELTRGQSNEQLPDITETLQEDLEFNTEHEDEDTDDSDVSMQTLITVLTRKDIPETVGFQKSGTTTPLTDAENADLDEEMLPQVAKPNATENPQTKTGIMPGERGRGKRQKFANKRYNGEAFWRHNDGDDWQDDSFLPTTC